jgi:hypothetical protein
MPPGACTEQIDTGPELVRILLLFQPRLIVKLLLWRNSHIFQVNLAALGEAAMRVQTSSSIFPEDRRALPGVSMLSALRQQEILVPLPELSAAVVP